MPGGVVRSMQDRPAGMGEMAAEQPRPNGADHGRLHGCTYGPARPTNIRICR
jgi:hypothetical protein